MAENTRKEQAIAKKGSFYRRDQPARANIQLNLVTNTNIYLRSTMPQIRCIDQGFYKWEWGNTPTIQKISHWSCINQYDMKKCLNKNIQRNLTWQPAALKELKSWDPTRTLHASCAPIIDDVVRDLLFSLWLRTYRLRGINFLDQCWY